MQSLNEAKCVKSKLTQVNAKILELKNEVRQLELEKITLTKKLSGFVKEYKEELQILQDKFNITHKTTDPMKPNKVIVDIGYNIKVPCIVYENEIAIPVLSYGLILKDGKPLLLYKYSNKNYVSITAIHVTDYGGPGDNYRTITCANTPNCQFNGICKYYHDPWEMPSNHIQHFTKNLMVKKFPYFGHGPLFVSQFNDIKFENLKTLARYCAIMQLLIYLISNNINGEN